MSLKNMSSVVFVYSKLAILQFDVLVIINNYVSRPEIVVFRSEAENGKVSING